MFEIRDIKDFSIIRIERKDLIIELLNYGATIYSLQTKDHSGVFEDIVLKYENIEDYLNNNIYLNATIGPIAGRVKNAEINIKDKTYHLDKNSDSKHTLHSGSLAVSFKYFDYEVTDYEDYTEVVFLYEETGKIKYQLEVIYQIYDNKVKIIYNVDTDQDFIFNLTNHAYFNLSGNLKKSILDHEVCLKSNRRYELDNELIVTGRILEEELYEFKGRDDLNKAVNTLKDTLKGGVDDIFYFPENDLRKVMATVYEKSSRRMMKVKSSYDNMVFYTHNNVNSLNLEHLHNHKKHYALCFECQKSPYGLENVNKSNPLLKKGEIYQETIIFEFFTM